MKEVLYISAPKSTITLFTPQFALSDTHPQVTLNNSLLPLERTLCIQREYAELGTSWDQQKDTILITYKSLFMHTAPIGSFNSN